MTFFPVHQCAILPTTVPLHTLSCLPGMLFPLLFFRSCTKVYFSLKTFLNPCTNIYLVWVKYLFNSFMRELEG